MWQRFDSHAEEQYVEGAGVAFIWHHYHVGLKVVCYIRSLQV